jgi:hypothetical protein
VTLNLATIGDNKDMGVDQINEDIKEEIKEIEQAKVSILDSKLKIGIKTLINSGVSRDES